MERNEPVEPVDGVRASAPPTEAGRAAPSANRPLVALASALIVGACCGRAVPASTTAFVVLCAMSVGAWLAARVLEGEVIATRRPSWSSLLLVAGLGALAGQPRASPPAGRHEGAWHPTIRTQRGVLGRLEHPRFEPAWFELPRDVVAPGEWIAVDPIDAPTLDARGPVPAPRALGESAERRVALVRADEIERLGTAPPWDRSTAWLHDARKAFTRRCAVFESGAMRELARALLCGDTSGLSTELSQLFRRTGLLHVLAVSGMHITLLAGLFLAPAATRLQGRARAAWITAVVAFATVFAALTGAEAPVRRAVIALAVTVWAPRLAGNRRVDGLSLLALGVLAEAAFDPRCLFKLSFQLSYSATAALILGTRPLATALRGPTTPRTFGATGPRAALSRTVGRAVRGSVAASMAAVVFTLPWMWATFGEWAPIGVALTALTTPLIAWMLIVGWGALLWPNPGLVGAFEGAGNVLLATMEWADRWPGTPHPLPPRPAWLLFAAVALASAAILRSERWSGLWPTLIRRAACLAWGLLLVPWHVRADALVVDALDVGHGTCVVLRAPRGPTWVFDAGSRDRSRIGAAALGPLLAASEAGELVVVLSHVDSDHASGLDWLVERYPIRVFGGAFPARLSERLAHTAVALDAPRAGDRIRLPSLAGACADLVRGQANDDNEGSRSLFITWPGHGLALHGDASTDGLATWLGPQTPVEKASVVLWPHHGDDTPLAGELLRVHEPDEVWISASGPAEIERDLARQGVRVRTTDDEGPLRRVFPLR